MKVFLIALLTLTDEGVFKLDDDSQMKIMSALVAMLEKMRDVSEDSFMHLFMKNQGF